ncbi:MAG: hypothetical protein K2M46_02545 [Lachnospiraceae bacterium]|nr:hypothetical protein [Lachnospiraceae bacterium]
MEKYFYDTYHIKKTMVSEREVYIIPEEYLKYEWKMIIRCIGWNEERIQHSYIDIIEQFENAPLSLGVVYIEKYKKPYNFMPSLCFYKDGAYHLVAYKQEWFCQNCMYKTPRQFHGITNVLMPLFEHETDCYPPEQKYPSIPAFFQKKKCPYCGYTIHQHLFCLDDYF